MPDQAAQPFQLPRQAYDRVRPLIQASGMRGHLALVYEALEERRPGQIFVNDAENPRTAIVCGASGFCFALGEPDEALLGQVIRQHWKAGMDENYTTLFGSSAAWTVPLKRAFSPYHAQRESRLAFELKSPSETPVIPGGFALQPITAVLAQSILDGSGTDHFGIDPWFIRTAGGAEAYAAYGLGLALMQGGCIASICGICGMGGGEVEPEVGTIPAFRGRGLATVVSAAFMQECLARGLKMAYSCSSDNYASIHVAHKLGYIEIEEIHGYRLFEPN